MTRPRSRALLVESDPALRMQLVRTLEAEGFTVDEARTGSAAVASVSISTPDVVVLSLALPDLPALDVLGAVRRRGDAPVVLVWGTGEDEDADIGITLGAEGSVRRPVDDGELVRQLRRALFKRSAARPR